jgi:antiviral helicase SKI2
MVDQPVPEGSIVRCIVRLDETCRELKGAGHIMGDTALIDKAEEAAIRIKRDICFTSSLYT